MEKVQKRYPSKQYPDCIILMLTKLLELFLVGSESFAMSLSDSSVHLIHAFSLWPSYPINKREITQYINRLQKPVQTKRREEKKRDTIQTDG